MSFSEKRPVASSILVAFVFVLVIFVAGMTSVVTGVSSEVTLFIAFAVVALVLIIHISRKNHWSYYGFRSIGKVERGDRRLFVPLYILASLPLITGFSADLTVASVTYAIVFMAIVAFVEETIFRGVVLKTLQRKSNTYAIWGSCLLFSIPHIMNSLNGKDLVQTIIQILFAFVIGLILAILVLKSNNIILAIGYHFTNNVVSSLTISDTNGLLPQYLTVGVFVLGAVFLLYLYRITNNNAVTLPKESTTESAA